MQKTVRLMVTYAKKIFCFTSVDLYQLTDILISSLKLHKYSFWHHTLDNISEPHNGIYRTHVQPRVDRYIAVGHTNAENTQ